MQELGLQTLLGVGGLGEELPLLSGCVPCPQSGAALKNQSGIAFCPQAEKAGLEAEGGPHTREGHA